MIQNIEVQSNECVKKTRTLTFFTRFFPFSQAHPFRIWGEEKEGGRGKDSKKFHGKFADRCSCFLLPFRPLSYFFSSVRFGTKVLCCSARRPLSFFTKRSRREKKAGWEREDFSGTLGSARRAWRSWGGIGKSVLVFIDGKLWKSFRIHSLDHYFVQNVKTCNSFLKFFLSLFFPSFFHRRSSGILSKHLLQSRENSSSQNPTDRPANSISP